MLTAKANSLDIQKYLGNDLAGDGHDVIGLYRNSMPENAVYKLIKADISEPLGGGIEDIDDWAVCAHGRYNGFRIPDYDKKDLNRRKYYGY